MGFSIVFPCHIIMCVDNNPFSVGGHSEKQTPPHPSTAPSLGMRRQRKSLEGRKIGKPAPWATPCREFRFAWSKLWSTHLSQAYFLPIIRAQTLHSLRVRRWRVEVEGPRTTNTKPRKPRFSFIWWSNAVCCFASRFGSLKKQRKIDWSHRKGMIQEAEG